jgi:hypothetical protein
MSHKRAGFYFGSLLAGWKGLYNLSMVAAQSFVPRQKIAAFCKRSKAGKQADEAEN